MGFECENCFETDEDCFGDYCDDCNAELCSLCVAGMEAPLCDSCTLAFHEDEDLEDEDDL